VRRRIGVPWEAQPSRWAGDTPRRACCNALVGDAGTHLACAAQTACVLVYNTPPPAFFMIPAAILLLLSAFMRSEPTPA